MITYEYKYVTIDIDQEQQGVVDLGLAKAGDVERLVLDVVNLEGQEGWEALYPFSFPTVWFRRTKNTRKKA